MLPSSGNTVSISQPWHVEARVFELVQLHLEAAASDASCRPGNMTALVAQTSQAEEADQQGSKPSLKKSEQQVVEQPDSPRCGCPFFSESSRSNQQRLSYELQKLQHVLEACTCGAGVLVPQRMTIGNWKVPQLRSSSEDCHLTLRKRKCSKLSPLWAKSLVCV